MSAIESARPVLDRQANVAIWYTVYEKRDEAIQYVNECFSLTFGIPIDEILEKKRYYLVNPPGTAEEIIEQYKDEDLTAIKEGIFMSRNEYEPGKDIVVVKCRFDQGMLGMFKIVDSEADDAENGLQNMDEEILVIMRTIGVDN